MTLLGKLCVDTEAKFHSALGNILKESVYRGYELTQEDKLDFINEGLRRGYCISSKNALTLKDMNMEIISTAATTPENDAPVTDYIVANFYSRKVESCVKRNIPFELSFAQVRRLLKKKTCHYTGIKLTHRSQLPNSWTLDRINSKLGYTKENTVVCSHSINQLKNELLENPQSKFRTDVDTLRKFISKLDL